jgi:hypothetical protein
MRFRWKEPARTALSQSRAHPGATPCGAAAAQAPAATTASTPPAQSLPPTTSPGASACSSHAAASRWTSSSVSACRDSTQSGSHSLAYHYFSHMLCAELPLHYTCVVPATRSGSHRCLALHPGLQVRVCQELSGRPGRACCALGSASQCMARTTSGRLCTRAGSKGPGASLWPLHQRIM